MISKSSLKCALSHTKGYRDMEGSSFIRLVKKTNTVVSIASMIGVHATINMTSLNSTCCLWGGGAGVSRKDLVCLNKPRNRRVLHKGN